MYLKRDWNNISEQPTFPTRDSRGRISYVLFTPIITNPPLTPAYFSIWDLAGAWQGKQDPASVHILTDMPSPYTQEPDRCGTSRLGFPQHHRNQTWKTCRCTVSISLAGNTGPDDEWGAFGDGRRHVSVTDFAGN